jgi:thiol-disulfide isomerase/thioredoxin
VKRIPKYFLIILMLISIPSPGQEIPKWKLSDLKKLIHQSEQPLIINFWATFCKPCLEELPYFQVLADQYKYNGVKLILVSLDLPEDYNKIQAFAVKHQINAAIVYLDETNADLFCPAVDKDWSGSIPASLLINNKNAYRKFFEGKISAEKLEAEINSMIKK